MAKRPRLTEGDRKLWQAVARTVTPLDRKSAAIVTPAAADDPSAELLGGHRPLPHVKADTGPKARPKTPPKRLPPTHPLDEGDPKQARRVARGRTDIDATLDLHGMTQAEAEVRLNQFVSLARAVGHRTVLVVTGKGSPLSVARVPFGEAPRGILRERFLEWVAQAPLRDKIASVKQSHQRHGGRGAFYVFLKKAAPPAKQRTVIKR